MDEASPQREIQVQSETPDHQKNTLSRRQFLKIGLAGAAALSTDQVNSALRNLNILPEGNPFQMAGSLAENFAQALAQEGEKREAFIAWLKFNAAKFYAEQRGMPMAGMMVNHFLYGEGRDLDISEAYLQSIRDLAKGRPEALKEVNTNIESISDTDLLILHTKQLFSHKLTFLDTTPKEILGGLAPFRGGDHGSSGPYVQFIEDDRSIPVQLEFLQSTVGKKTRIFGIAASTGFSRDRQYAINEHTYSAKGEVVEVDSNTNAITFAPNSTITVYDRYDWAISDLGASTTIGEYVKESGLQDTLHLSEDVLQQLEKINLEIKDNEGKLLVDQGMAHEFDAYASYKIDKPYTLALA